MSTALMRAYALLLRHAVQTQQLALWPTAWGVRMMSFWELERCTRYCDLLVGVGSDEVKVFALFCVQSALISLTRSVQSAT
jgi:hypothetical protein